MNWWNIFFISWPIVGIVVVLLLWYLLDFKSGIDLTLASFLLYFFGGGILGYTMLILALLQYSYLFTNFLRKLDSIILIKGKK